MIPKALRIGISGSISEGKAQSQMRLFKGLHITFDDVTAQWPVSRTTELSHQSGNKEQESQASSVSAYEISCLLFFS